MTYREYEYNGKLQRHRDSGMRILDEMTDWKNPDGSYWESKAQANRVKLKELLGSDYILWAEIALPDEVFQGTWMDIYNLTLTALKIGRDALLSTLECSCLPDGACCLVCQAAARLSEHDHGITY